MTQNQSLIIAVGSKNQVKIRAARNGFKKVLKYTEEEAESLLTLEGFDVPSGISDQPLSDEETLKGAINRAEAAYNEYYKTHGKYPDYSVGLEGGVELNKNEELECFAWIVIYNGNKYGKGRTCSFYLPNRIRDLVIKEKMELGHADDLVFSTVDSKRNGGSVGQFTRGVINRDEYYESATVFAFVPFLWPDFY